MKLIYFIHDLISSVTIVFVQQRTNGKKKSSQINGLLNVSSTRTKRGHHNPMITLKIPF